MRVPPSRKRKRDGNAHLNNEGPEPNNGENITNNNEDDGRCQYCFLSPCIIELTSSSPVDWCRTRTVDTQPSDSEKIIWEILVVHK